MFVCLFLWTNKLSLKLLTSYYKIGWQVFTYLPEEERFSKYYVILGFKICILNIMCNLFPLSKTKKQIYKTEECMHCEYICMKRISDQPPPRVITLHLRPMVGNTSPIRATLRIGSQICWENPETLDFLSFIRETYLHVEWFRQSYSQIQGVTNCLYL